MPKQKVIILGATGMLGSTVVDFFVKSHKFDITGTYRDYQVGKHLKNRYSNVNFRRLDVEKASLKSIMDIIKGAEWLINAIGITKPYIHDENPPEVERAILVNSFFPHLLAKASKNTGTKVIQIATDCVYSGQKGRYLETDSHDALDVYGKTKSLGEVTGGNFLNIRGSIIGLEKGMKKNFLLEWFLDQPDGSTVKGYTHHKWNGVTTLQFAKLCSMIIASDKFDKLIKMGNTHHFVPNNTVSKFELLRQFAKIFRKKINIVPVDNPPPVDRTLSTKYNIISSFFPASTIEKALEELKEYMKG